jgi:hypothetical protein
LTPGKENRIKLICRNDLSQTSRKKSEVANSMEFSTPALAYNLPPQEQKVVLYEKPKLPKPYSAAFHLKGIYYPWFTCI